MGRYDVCGGEVRRGGVWWGRDGNKVRKFHWGETHKDATTKLWWECARCEYGALVWGRKEGKWRRIGVGIPFPRWGVGGCRGDLTVRHTCVITPFSDFFLLHILLHFLGLSAPSPPPVSSPCFFFFPIFILWFYKWVSSRTTEQPLPLPTTSTLLFYNHPFTLQSSCILSLSSIVLVPAFSLLV